MSRQRNDNKRTHNNCYIIVLSLQLKKIGICCGLSNLSRRDSFEKEVNFIRILQKVVRKKHTSSHAANPLGNIMTTVKHVNAMILRKSLMRRKKIENVNVLVFNCIRCSDQLRYQYRLHYHSYPCID